MAGNVKSKNLLEAAEQGNLALMVEMRRTLGRKSQGQAVPEELDGKVTHDTILDCFRECYEELYNSAGSEDAMVTIKEELNKLITDQACVAAGEVGKVTGKIVKQACSRMLPGKTDVSEVYTSDVFSMPQITCLINLLPSSGLTSPMGQSASRS